MTDVAGLAPSALRMVFSAFPSGIVALGAVIDGTPVGMAASSFTSVSLRPPLVSVCIARESRTWPQLKRAERIGISVLSDAHEAVCRRLSAPDGDRFRELSWRGLTGGALVIDGSAAAFQCSLEREVDAGDHRIALLRVRVMTGGPNVPPLVFHGSRYRSLAP